MVVPDKLPVLSPANPVTFTIYSESTFPEMAANNRFLKALKDELGVTLQIDNSGGMNTAEKIGIMITSGDLPDLMYCKMMSHPDDGKLYVLPNYNRFYGEVVLGDYDGAVFLFGEANTV
jgi:putative aldouronate transport system substrate-binding protein